MIKQVTFINDRTGERIVREIEVYDSDCIDSPDRPHSDSTEACSGEVFPRLSLTGASRTERCELHYSRYAAAMQPRLDEIARRYPKQAPADFDPTYAGESWDEEDY